MTLNDFKSRANEYGKLQRPFLFLLDFELKKPLIIPLDRIEDEKIFFEMHGVGSQVKAISGKKNSGLKAYPMKFKEYAHAFEIAQKNLDAGNTYLINITFPTTLSLDLDLESIFLRSKAPYKLLFKDQFTLFSPECFVRTQNGHIYSYPMKGTIDASIPNAANVILSNKKETWEHNTIVDLIRNDLAMVSRNITVTKFRFITEVRSRQRNLLQVSSEIRGDLNPDWNTRIGDMLCDLLPAGSISGAPKKRTLEIIREAEKQDRGYFTGVFGIFDGRELDSAVNIRYIERTDRGLQFRSGGGITAMSDPHDEYREMVDKIYVPLS